MDLETGQCRHEIDAETCVWCCKRDIRVDDTYAVSIYFGQCELCRRPISPGDGIGLYELQWVCETCCRKGNQWK
jgi:hypothetical protein